MRFISLFLVGILCCSIFAGCSSNVSEEDIQGPEAISQGKVAQESVSIVFEKEGTAFINSLRDVKDI